MTARGAETLTNHGFPAKPTVTIGILTYRRPALLAMTVASVAEAIGDDDDMMWQVDEVLIVDNDQLPSAADTVEKLKQAGYRLPLRHHHEPRPGLAAARNAALDQAGGDILVFIDDDERAEAGWPHGLIETMTATGAALVGGPVRTDFTVEPPRWVRVGGFFEREEHALGTELSWLRSGNLAIDLTKIREQEVRFDHRFGLTGGEDVAFSRAARARGLDLRWNDRAIVTELVGPERTTLPWIVGRERRSTTNWVRAEIGDDPSLKRKAVVIARAGFRLLQGLAVTFGGIAGRNRARTYRGLVTMNRGIGALLGLLDRSGRAYGALSEESTPGL